MIVENTLVSMPISEFVWIIIATIFSPILVLAVCYLINRMLKTRKQYQDSLDDKQYRKYREMRDNL